MHPNGRNPFCRHRGRIRAHESNLHPMEPRFDQSLARKRTKSERRQTNTRQCRCVSAANRKAARCSPPDRSPEGPARANHVRRKSGFKVRTQPVSATHALNFSARASNANGLRHGKPVRQRRGAPPCRRARLKPARLPSSSNSAAPRRCCPWRRRTASVYFPCRTTGYQHRHSRSPWIV